MNLKKGIVGETLITLLSIILGVLTNRFLGAEQRGMLAAVMLYPTILSSVSSLQWDRQIISDIKSKIVSSDLIKSQIVTTALTNGVVAALIVVVLSITDNKISTHEIILIGIYSLISIPCSLIQLYNNAYLIAKDRTMQVYGNRILMPLIMLCLLMALISAHQISYSHIVIITMIAWAMTAIYILTAHKISLLNLKLDYKNLITQLAQYKKNMAHLLDSVSTHMDIIVVLNLLPLNFAGAYIFFKLIDLPFKIITFAFGTATAGLLVIGGNINIRYLGKYLIFITMIMGSVLIIPINYLETIIDLVVGPSYLQFSYLIKPLTICFWTSAVGLHGYSLLTHAGAVAKLYSVQKYDFLLRTLLMVALTQAFGWIGLVLSIVVSNCMRVVIIGWQYAIYKRLKVKDNSVT